MTTVPPYEQLIEPVLRVLARHPNGLKTPEAYEEVSTHRVVKVARTDSDYFEEL